MVGAAKFKVGDNGGEITVWVGTIKDEKTEVFMGIFSAVVGVRVEINDGEGKPMMTSVAGEAKTGAIKPGGYCIAVKFQVGSSHCLPPQPGLHTQV